MHSFTYGIFVICLSVICNSLIGTFINLILRQIPTLFDQLLVSFCLFIFFLVTLIILVIQSPWSTFAVKYFLIESNITPFTGIIPAHGQGRGFIVYISTVILLSFITSGLFDFFSLYSTNNFLNFKELSQLVVIIFLLIIFFFIILITIAFYYGPEYFVYNPRKRTGMGEDMQ